VGVGGVDLDPPITMDEVPDLPAVFPWSLWCMAWRFANAGKLVGGAVELAA